MRPARIAAVVTWAVIATACAGSATIDRLTTDGVHGTGVIAIGSPLRLVDSSGDDVAVTDDVAPITQPTWSRDGTRVIVTRFGDTGAHRTVVIDGESGTEIGSAPSPRPHFFFSWSHDGEHVAALGPGLRGTTLDLLADDGTVRHEAILGAGSLFLAWEPEGDRLTVNADGELLVLEPDGAGRWIPRTLRRIGTRSLVPKWIPGSGDVLAIDAPGGQARLVRIPVGSGEEREPAEPVDLGSVLGAAAITVHPDGDRAVISQVAVDGDDTAVPAAFAPAPEGTGAAVEIVDLRDGVRTPVLDDVAWWAEWSPDGRRLLLATIDGQGQQGRWHVWNDAGATIEQETAFVPTADFFVAYLRFADQYVEQPRLWAPDSTAFVTSSRRVDGDRVLVIEAGTGGAIDDIAAGTVAFWSPMAPTP